MKLHYFNHLSYKQRVLLPIMPALIVLQYTQWTICVNVIAHAVAAIDVNIAAAATDIDAKWYLAVQYMSIRKVIT